MAAHRYWRLRVTATQGTSNLVVIGELVMATTPGGAQAAVGGTGSASSVGAGTVASMFDGTTSSSNAWSSLSTPATETVWVQYDFGVGVTVDVAELRIYFPAAGTFPLNSAPRNMTLYWSDDGVTFTRQRSWGSIEFTQGGTLTFSTTELTSGEVTNRIMLSQFRYVLGANPQTWTSNMTRSPGIARAYGYTRPWVMTPFTGRKRLAGSTTSLGLPNARRVNLYDQFSGVLVATRDTSLPGGTFEFADIADRPYTVMGVDATAEQNSVVFAHVTPVD